MPYTSYRFFICQLSYIKKRKKPATILLFRRVPYSKKKAPRTFANQQSFVVLTAYLTANRLKNTLSIRLILKPNERIAHSLIDHDFDG